MKQLFLIEATKYHVVPLDDRTFERFNPELAGRPQLMHGRTQLLFGGMGRLTEGSILVVKNKSHAVSAEIEVPDLGARGVIISQGGSVGGWSLYAKDGRLAYCYNFLGIERFMVESPMTIPAGVHQARMEFIYDGGGLGKGGTVSLFVDGARVGTGRVDSGFRRRRPSESCSAKKYTWIHLCCTPAVPRS